MTSLSYNYHKPWSYSVSPLDGRKIGSLFEYLLIDIERSVRQDQCMYT